MKTSQLRLRVDPETRAILDNIRIVLGMPISEQIRRALALWVDEARDRYQLQPRPARRKAAR